MPLVQRKGTATLLWRFCHEPKLIFNRVKITWKENQRREFYYQLIHCIVATKKELTLYGITDNNRCLFCDEPDPVLCTFQNCSTITSFHHRLLNWFSEMQNTSILFSMVSRKANDNPRKLNFCLLFANYYLSYHKVNETNLDWVEFITKVNHFYNHNYLYCLASSHFPSCYTLSKGVKLMKGYEVICC